MSKYADSQPMRYNGPETVNSPSIPIIVYATHVICKCGEHVALNHDVDRLDGERIIGKCPKCGQEYENTHCPKD